MALSFRSWHAEKGPFVSAQPPDPAATVGVPHLPQRRLTVTATSVDLLVCNAVVTITRLSSISTHNTFSVPLETGGSAHRDHAACDVRKPKAPACFYAPYAATKARRRSA